MRIGHCQLEAKTGDSEANLARVVRGLERMGTATGSRSSASPSAFSPGTRTGRRRCGSRRSRSIPRRGRSSWTRPVGSGQQSSSGSTRARGADLDSTAVAVHKGHILGTYSMCPAYMKFDKPGREFPGSGRGGAKFGVIISSGGGYTEPARILALKMARITFAPAFSYVGPRGVIGHFQEVRPDRSARPVENDVWPVRGDNVARDKDPSPRFEGVGSGDSYVIDPSGETGARGRRHREDWIFTDVDPAASDESWGAGRSLRSAPEFGKLLRAAAEPPR